MIQLNQPK